MTDERAVSVTVSYALNLVVATVLVAGLLTVTGGLVEDRRQSAIQSGLTVVGNRVAADLMSADRLVQAGSNPDVRIETVLPNRVAGSHYLLTVNASASDPHLSLRSDDPAVTVNVSFRTTTTVRDGTISGGDLSIVLVDDGSLEVSG